MSSNYTRPLARLIEEFQKLPGIGPKSAQRLAFHVLRQPSESIERFSTALLDAKDKIGFCQVCYNLSCQSPCELCSAPNRNPVQICVVPDPKDLYALERTNEFKGFYHILHGMISPLEGVGPEDLKIRELLARLQPAPLLTDDVSEETHAHMGVKEVILALPPSIEGDTTSLYLSRLIKPLGLTLTRIAFGLPAGGDLEYADTMTITRALQGRREV
ncbi:MAG: recombination mediator RecR [Vampirovibrionales bacterium]|nr:recombination mediator RecR [Vampirovibrionales bacterium]